MRGFSGLSDSDCGRLAPGFLLCQTTMVVDWATSFLKGPHRLWKTLRQDVGCVQD